MSPLNISSALISVYDKNGIDQIAHSLIQKGIQILSTGGTYDYLHGLGISVTKVEELTNYPSILGGRVKTLHPKIFGGILSDRSEEHQSQSENYAIPNIDLVIVDLYPFEDTVASTSEEADIIEKIDIGGISLIRAAAKNYRNVVIIPSKNEYSILLEKATEAGLSFSLEERKRLAARAFDVSSHYDTAIYQYFHQGSGWDSSFKISSLQSQELRYGENPHQKGRYFGDLGQHFHQLSGKELSYNNLVDVDAAIQLMADFEAAKPTFAVIKHTNACGVASADRLLEAWQKALQADNVSAFGGILISNRPIDIDTAQEIDTIFYEILLAPGYHDDALSLLRKKKKRILLQYHSLETPSTSYRSLLSGTIVQEADKKVDTESASQVVTKLAPTSAQMNDLLFASKCCKHLKSNTIVLVRDQQLLGMGCGQTSRVDALKQAIAKAKAFGFDLEAAVMASDAFFPFSDCVEIAAEAGIRAVIQPGGSMRDQDSIDACDERGLAMVTTGIRHFKH